MGCASSTPMIATAGSEMLKSATHVAEDAAKGAEGVAQDVAHTLGQSVDAATETLGNAVTDVTDDVGRVLKEKADQLEDAQSVLVSKLHLSAEERPEEAQTNKETETTREKQHAMEMTTNKDDSMSLDDDDDNARPETRSAAPTPAPDADSLKTSTPEPEIERVLAKCMAESPPTPKPTYAELEKLTTTTLQKLVKSEKKAEGEEAAKNPTEAEEKVASATESNSSEPSAVDSLDAQPPDDELKRPSTTEWEKYADMLSHQRKFKASDAFKIGGKFKSTAFQPKRSTESNRAADLPAESRQKRRSGIPQRVHDQGDSGLSDNNTNNNSSSCYSSPHHSNESIHENQNGILRLHRHHLPTTLNAANTKQFQHEFASLIASQHSQVAERTRSQAPSRSQSRLQSPTNSRSAARVSNKASPFVSRSSTMTSLFGSQKESKGGKGEGKSRKDSGLSNQSASRSRSRSRSHGILNKSVPRLVGSRPVIVGVSVGVEKVRSSPRVMNTSSFLSSPRQTPFISRKNYSELADQENKATFVSDLSSSPNNRSLSPYKIRERCSVCYNKYVI